MHVLFLAPRFPLPAIKGDKLRAWQCIRALSKNHCVSLVTYVQNDEERAAIEALSAFCEVHAVSFNPSSQYFQTALKLFSSDPLQLGYYASSTVRRSVRDLWKGVDAVHLNTIRMADNLPNEIDKPVVVDFIDALSLGTKRWADSRGGVVGTLLSEESDRLRACESRWKEKAARAVCVGEADAKHIGGIEVLPHAVDTEQFSPGGDEYEKGLVVLTGNFAYAPNVEAAVWFARSIWPEVSAAKPEARLRIMGANPANAVRALEGPGVEVAGYVDDMTIELRKAHVSVAPLLSGAGAQTKVLEAMACGVPVVATPLANAAIGAKDGQDILLGKSEKVIARQVLSVLDDEGLRDELAEAGRAYVSAHFSMDTLEKRLLEIYDSLV